jgi:hypothetical protein
VIDAFLRSTRMPQMQSMLAETSVLAIRRLSGTAGFGRGAGQFVGGALGANATQALGGAANVAGGIGQVGGAVAGRVLGAVGMGAVGGLVGMGIGFAAAAATKALIGLAGITTQLSEQFSRFNAGVAASQAMVTVEQVKANIRMANAAEPLIEAFNRMRISVIRTTASLTEVFMEKFGPMLIKLFDKIAEWTNWIANQVGIKTTAPEIPGMAFAGMIQRAANVAAGPGTIGEMMRRAVSGPMAGREQGMISAIATQRERLRQEERDLRSLGSLVTPSQQKFYEADLERLRRLNVQYDQMRKEVARRYPLGQAPFRPKVTIGHIDFKGIGGYAEEGRWGGITRGTLPYPTMAEAQARLQEVLGKTKAIEASGVPAPGPYGNAFTRWFAKYFVGPVNRVLGTGPLAELPALQKQQRYFQMVVNDLAATQAKYHDPRYNDPRFVESAWGWVTSKQTPISARQPRPWDRIAADLRQVQRVRGGAQAEMDKIEAEERRRVQAIGEMWRTHHSELWKAQHPDIVNLSPENIQRMFPPSAGYIVHHETLRKTIEDMNKAEKSDMQKIEAERKSYFKGRISTTPPHAEAPKPFHFSQIDIKQTVEFNLDMKLAHEKQVNEAVAKIRDILSMGINEAKDEARLALVLSSTGNGGMV